MKKGWHEEKGNKYYFNEYGAAITGQTVVIDGKECTFDRNGVLKKEIRKGWYYENNNWYYNDENGNKVKGWLKSNDISYYFKEDGSAAVGWHIIDGYDYYFYENCSMAKLEFIDNIYFGVDGRAKDIRKGGKYKIVIDPGHFNKIDKGSVKIHNGITYEEGVINMKIAQILKINLEKQGYEVLLTRNEFNYWPKNELKNRVDLANTSAADLFISIHQDSFSSSSANGMTIFYDTYRPNIDNLGIKVDSNGNSYDETPSKAAMISQEFAEELSESLPKNLNIRNRGTKYSNFYVTQNTLMPSLLIECGFLSNPEEAKKISDISYQNKLVQLLVENINKLFRK